MTFHSPANFPLLRLEQVSLAASVGVDFILRNISFSVNQEDKIAIVGASGSGKTSLLRLLNRLVNPVEGEIFYLDTSYSKHDVLSLRRQVMLVPQEPKLLGMTGKQALIYPLELQNINLKTIENRLQYYCDALKIPAAWLERNELQLSLGQRQIITIVRALMLEPKILLLDEPTSALDRGLSDRLLTALEQINFNRQTTILMVNHQLEIAQQFANRILYFSLGKLLLDTVATQAKWQQISDDLLKENQNSIQEWE